MFFTSDSVGKLERTAPSEERGKDGVLLLVEVPSIVENAGGFDIVVGESMCGFEALGEEAGVVRKM